MGVFKFNVGDVLYEIANPKNKIKIIGLRHNCFYEFGDITNFIIHKNHIENNFELDSSSISYIERMLEKAMNETMVEVGDVYGSIRGGKDLTQELYDEYALIKKQLYLDFTKRQQTRSFLPTKIIFDYDKKKTTLLFGDVPYESFNATASNGDDFNMGVGFLIAYYKYLNRNNQKHNVNDVIKYFYDFTNTYALFVGIVTNHLLNQDMSFKQVDKLFVAISEQKSVKFNISGKDYHIEIEVRKSE